MSNILVGSQKFSNAAIAGAGTYTTDEIKIDDNFDRMTVMGLSSLLDGTLDLQVKLNGVWVTAISFNLSAGIMDSSSVYHYYPFVRFVFTAAAGITTAFSMEMNIVKHLAQ
jgi:hypothetical protein